jgi:hypothetical protein
LNRKLLVHFEPQNDNVGLNGVSTTTHLPGLTTLNQNKSWRWVNTVYDEKVAVAVPEAGIHVFNVWAREDGTRMDRFVLTTDASYDPSTDGSGIGPDASPLEVANTAPVTIADLASTTKGVGIEIAVAANDTDDGLPMVPGALSVLDSESAVNGFVELLSDGKIRYTPVWGFVGVDNFKVTITDGSLTSQSLVTIEVLDGPTDYAYWLANPMFSQLSMNERDPLFDADFDGIVNLLEYGFGFDPMVNDSSSLTPNITIDGENFIFTFQVGHGVDDLGYAVEYSADFSKWNTVDSADITVIGPASVGQATLMQASVPIDLGRVFFRVQFF